MENIQHNDHNMPNVTQNSALCCMSNVEALYVTQAEVRSLVVTWTVLLKLGIDCEDPLSGAIVARAVCDGGIQLLNVQRCEVDHDGKQKSSWDIRFLKYYSQEVSTGLR